MRGLLSNRGNGNVGRRILLQVDKHRFDRVDDANVARTSAQVSRELKSNSRFISVWKTLHDISRGNEHAGRTVAALQPVMNRERPAQTLHQIIVVEAFDRPNLLMITGHCERDAGAHRFTAYKDRTRATNAVLATEVVPVRFWLSRRKSPRWVRGATSPRIARLLMVSSMTDMEIPVNAQMNRRLAQDSARRSLHAWIGR